MTRLLLRIGLAACWLSLGGWGVSTWAGVLEVPLIPELDQFGSQIETIQAYGEGADQRIAFSIYDTGASVVTLSATDQLVFDLLGSPVPIKVPNGAQADAIGGVLVGDVSAPGTVLADGLHAFSINFANLEIDYDFAQAAVVPGVQMFVGTSQSQSLPTITGTPIHYPSARHPSGAAAQVDMLGYAFDLGEMFPELPEFDGIVYYLPDVSFVDSGATITAGPDTTEVARIPMALFGEGNHPDPGDMVTVAVNPVQTGVSLEHLAQSVAGQTFLFDTGAQLSIISTQIAEELGLDLDHPETSIDVQGAAGVAESIPGYTIDVLTIPRDDDGDGLIDGSVRFTDAPVYVLDLIEGLDGILGMNLFNPASKMLYDPYDPLGPSLRVSFLTDRELPTEEELAAQMALADSFPMLSGALGLGSGLPNFQMRFDEPPGVPEPSSLALLGLGGAALWFVRHRRKTAA